MKHRHFAVALLVALAPAALVLPPVCGVCRAQSATDDATTATARARFKEGVEYFDKGQFELARAAFLQAYALKKHPAVLLNLAWSCLKSAHVSEGARYFEQFLNAGGEITDKQRADANDGLNQARAKLGRIELAGAPAGTDVSVDGESAGAVPLSEPIFVEPGTRSVKMRGPDGSVDTESATVTAGERVVVRFTHPMPATAAAVPVPPPAPAPTAPLVAVPERAAPLAPPSEPAAAPSASPSAVPPEPPARSNEDMSIVPFFVGGVVVVASAAVAIAMKVSKDSAQNKADTTARQIATYESQNAISPIRCASSPQMAALPAKVVDACSVWNNDNKLVNEDATIANVAIGVGVAALVGTAIYGIVYATHSRPAPRQATIAPVVGPSFGGITLRLAF